MGPRGRWKVRAAPVPAACCGGGAEASRLVTAGVAYGEVPIEAGSHAIGLHTFLERASRNARWDCDVGVLCLPGRFANSRIVFDDPSADLRLYLARAGLRVAALDYRSETHELR